MRQHTRTLLIAVAMAFPAVITAQEPVDVTKLTFSAPSTIATLEKNDIKGQPARLAWSADGSELYLQSIDGNFGLPPAPQRHYVFDATTGKKRSAQGEPEWAAAYWAMKSDRAAPDLPSMQIDLTSETRVEKMVSTPMGGALARGGVGGDAGTGAGEAMSAAQNQTPVPVHTMRLGGETIGEFVNTVIVPGLTFGWGPKGSKVIAFSAQRSGRVVVMDNTGKKHEVGGTKDALLPAWSPDGQRLAWIQRDGKKYELKIARVE